MKTVEGHFTIHRVNGTIVIRLRDDAARTEILQIHIPQQSMTDAWPYGGEQPCEIQFKEANVRKLGKQKQSRVIEIQLPRRGERYPRPSDLLDKDEGTADAVLPYEIDGWRAQMSDFVRASRWLGRGRYSITFTRWI